MIKIDKKIKITLLLIFLSLAWFMPFSLLSRGFLPLKTSAPSFSWQDTTFSTSFERIWDGSSNVFNYSDSYEDVFSTNSNFYNETDNTWTRGISTTIYKANFSYFSNFTSTGNITVDLNVDVYQVNAQYKKVLDMYWFALKNGTIDMEYYLDHFTHDFTLLENYTQDIVTNYTKFDTATWDVLDTWLEYTNNSGVKNISQPANILEYTEYKSSSSKFCKPMILVTQLFTTENKDKFAWAELFSDFIVYKDMDLNGIYNAGEKTGLADFPSMNWADEHYGTLVPIAEELDYYIERIYPDEPLSSWNASITKLRPNDTSIEEIASSIVFTPPTIDEKEIISWEVLYPQHPIAAFVHGPGVETFLSGNSYASMSPTDLSYKYDYNISNSEANLDLTFGMSKISDSDLYESVQGMGLSVPHYNLFISSFDITEIDFKQLTVPSSLFTFESNESTVAQINLVNPKKTNYTLFDYPTTGVDTELESYGGSIHKGILDMLALSSYSETPIFNLIYTLEDMVAADLNFSKVDSLYHLETQNYPLWSGEKLLHDPTTTVYFDPQEEEQEPPTTPTPTVIPGFNAVLVVAVSSVVFLVIVAKTKKNKKIS